MPSMTTLLRVMPVTGLLVTTVHTMLVMIVPMMDTGAGLHTIRLGEPLRGRAFRCNLRCAPISAAIPLASVRFAHCALRLPDNRTRRADHPDTAPDIRFALLAPALRAALVAVCASLALAGCAGCEHRLGFAPVHPVCRRCRLRRAPACTPCPALVPAQARTLVADAAASASGSVLRTTACGSVRTVRHSIAVAAPLRRLRRRRFPLRSCRTIRPSRPPGRPWVSHPTHR